MAQWISTNLLSEGSETLRLTQLLGSCGPAEHPLITLLRRGLPAERVKAWVVNTKAGSRGTPLGNCTPQDNALWVALNAYEPGGDWAAAAGVSKGDRAKAKEDGGVTREAAEQQKLEVLDAVSGWAQLGGYTRVAGVDRSAPPHDPSKPPNDRSDPLNDPSEPPNDPSARFHDVSERPSC